MVDIQIVVLIFFAVHLRATHSGIIPKNNQPITEINELKSYFCAILPVCLIRKQQFITVLVASLVIIHHQTPPLW